MDGVLWRGDEPIGNLPRIFDRIGEIGLKVAFATNNGTRTPEQYADRLAGYGVNIDPQQVVTSAHGVVQLLADHFSSKHADSPIPVYAIGEKGVMDALQERGFEPLASESAGEAKAVVFGLDRMIDFKKMAEATLLVRNGIPFFATNSDKTFPTPRGEIPGAGAWISVIVTATGVEPVYAGKPAPYLLELARNRLGTLKSETLVVGDRLETDIAGGQAAGLPVALVLSGVCSIKEGTAWGPEVDYIADNLGALLE